MSLIYQIIIYLYEGDMLEIDSCSDDFRDIACKCLLILFGKMYGKRSRPIMVLDPYITRNNVVVTQKSLEDIARVSIKLGSRPFNDVSMDMYGQVKIGLNEVRSLDGERAQVKIRFFSIIDEHSYISFSFIMELERQRYDWNPVSAKLLTIE